MGATLAGAVAGVLVALRGGRLGDHRSAADRSLRFHDSALGHVVVATVFLLLPWSCVSVRPWST